MKLWQKILIGFVLGVLAGWIFGPKTHYLKPIGDLFINAIKMLVVPLVFSSLVVGVTSMNDPKKMGRIGLKTLSFLFCTTGVSAAIGISLAKLVKPGLGLSIPTAMASTQTQSISEFLIKTFTGIIPANPVQSFATADMMAIIVFAGFTGASIILLKEKGKLINDVFNQIAEVMYKMTELVMSLAPYGIFALMAWVTGKYGMKTLIPLMKVIGSLYVGCALQVFITMTIILLIFRLSPIKFFKGVFEASLVGFSTSSSSGTLPTTIRCAETKLGVSSSIANFVLPLGATIDMNGTAMYQAISAIFISQIYGIHLGIVHFVIIVLISIVGAIGTAGVPGSGLIMLSLVLSSVGLPLEGVALIAGIDRVLDMARTCVNVTGESLTALVVAKTEGELNYEIFNDDSNK